MAVQRSRSSKLPVSFAPVVMQSATGIPFDPDMGALDVLDVKLLLGSERFELALQPLLRNKLHASTIAIMFYRHCDNESYVELKRISPIIQRFI